MTSSTPRDIDTKLAEVHMAIYRAQDKLERNEMSMLSQAGAKFYYRGRQRVTDMAPAEAYDILSTWVAENTDDKFGYTRSPFSSANIGQARTVLENRIAIREELDTLHAEAEDLESQYTGWSRFFLVTSSPGHVHSSMHCTTCRPTTRYGWLPQLSGQDEKQAVDELGPTLCTVCFPSAPTEWTEGKKITAAQAQKKVA